jgi:DNA primase
MTPKGSSISGTVFADSRGRELLRGELAEGGSVILGEGLTDALALAIASPMPVLTAPGTGVAAAAVGPWARGRSVLLALDFDDAGNGAVKPVSRALFEQGATVRRLLWPKPAKDACDALVLMGAAGLGNFLSNPPRLESAS